MVEGTKEDSVITEEMVEAFAKVNGVELTDEARPGIVGSLVGLEEGKGTWEARLDGDDVRELFAPLRKAFEGASA